MADSLLRTVPNPLAGIHGWWLRVQAQPDPIQAELFVREAMSQVDQRQRHGELTEALDQWSQTGQVDRAAQVLFNALQEHRTEVQVTKTRAEILLEPLPKTKLSPGEWVRRARSLDWIFRRADEAGEMGEGLLGELEDWMARLEPTRDAARKGLEKVLVGAEPLSKGGPFLSEFRGTRYPDDRFLPDLLVELADGYDRNGVHAEQQQGTSPAPEKRKALATRLRSVAVQLSRAGKSPFLTLETLREYVREEALAQTQAAAIAAKLTHVERITGSGWDDLRLKIASARANVTDTEDEPLKGVLPHLRVLLKGAADELTLLEKIGTVTDAARILGAALPALKHRGLLQEFAALATPRGDLEKAASLLVDGLATFDEKASAQRMIDALELVLRQKRDGLGLAHWLQVFRAVESVHAAYPDTTDVLMQLSFDLGRLEKDRGNVRNTLRLLARGREPLREGGEYFTQFAWENCSARRLPMLLKVVAQRYQNASSCSGEGAEAVRHHRQIHGLLVQCADEISRLPEDDDPLPLVASLHNRLAALGLEKTRAFELVNRFHSADLATGDRFQELRQGCEAVWGAGGVTE